jgi:hypothetical protein
LSATRARKVCFAEAPATTVEIITTVAMAAATVHAGTMVRMIT